VRDHDDHDDDDHDHDHDDDHDGDMMMMMLLFVVVVLMMIKMIMMWAVTGTLVTPVLGFVERDIGDMSHLVPSPDEVEGVFALSLAQLLDPELR
jgi:hypothetical protein